MTANPHGYEFGPFRVDTQRLRLERDGELVALTPKVLETLLVLLERRTAIVSKEELMTRLWPDTFVTEANVTQNISTLRKALGEARGERRYVVTVPKQGYRFVAPVVPIVGVPQRAATDSDNTPRRRRGRWAVAASLLVALAAGGSWWVLSLSSRVATPDTEIAPSGLTASGKRPELSAKTGGEPRQALEIEARQRVAAREWRRAGEIYRSLANFFPAELEYSLALMESLREDGRAEEAMAHLDTLHDGSWSAVERLRIDLAEATTARALTDPRRQLAAARRARQAAGSLGDSLADAEARLFEASARIELGENDAGLALLKEVRATYATLGDRGREGRVLNMTAVAVNQLGRFAEAREFYEQALAAYVVAGDRRGQGIVEFNRGTLELDEGKTAAAFEHLALAREHLEAAADIKTLIRVWMAEGIVYRNGGDAEASRRAHSEALRLSREVGSLVDQALALNNLAAIEDSVGDLSRAGERYREARGLLDELGMDGDQKVILHNLAQIELRLGRPRAARQLWDQALDISRRMEDPLQARRIQIHLAELAALEGDLAGARSLAEAALEQALASAAPVEEAQARRVLAWLHWLSNDGHGVVEHARAALALQADEPVEAGRTRLILARLDQDAGEFRAVAKVAAEVALDARRGGARDVQATALALQASAQAALAPRADIQELAKEARRLAERGEDRLLRWLLAPDLARLDAELGYPQRAFLELEQVAEETRQAGLALLSVRARLALGELDPSRARQAVQVACEESRARQLGRLAEHCRV